MSAWSVKMNGMGFPGRYIQGPSVLSDLGKIAADYLEVDSATLIYDGILERYLPTFAESQLAVEPLVFPGSCSEDVVAALGKKAKQHRAGCIIGFGGGKTLDVAKAVASDLQRPLVIIPSAASSDAPTSRLVALYEGHQLTRSIVMRRNPDLVLVDTKLLIEAPRRLLIAGIGDALSKNFEVELSISNRVPNTFNMGSLQLSRLLAERCYGILRHHAHGALDEFDTQVPGEHFERLVEACVLYSGLAFEGGGLSLAHGLLRGLTLVPGTENHLHGELVAYGTLVQVLACDRQRHFFDELLAFIKSVGLPSRLSEIGVTRLTDEDLQRVARLALTAPYLQDGKQSIVVKDIVRAIKELEAC